MKLKEDFFNDGRAEIDGSKEEMDKWYCTPSFAQCQFLPTDAV
jgi:hypothetical protein